MSSLPQVLHEAANRSASEITIESDQPPMIRTSAGSVTMGDPLSEGELFEALAQVLAPEQQAELAVGNVVEFNMDVDNGRWSMISEPSSDGIVVRGRLQGGSASVEMGRRLDLPPLEPVEPERSDRAPRTPRPVLKRTTRQTQWDLNVGGEDKGSGESPEAPAVSAAPAGADAEPDFELRTPTGEEPANLVDAHEPDPDDVPVAEVLPDLIDPALSSSERNDVAPVDGAGPFAHYGRSIQPGTLCLVQGRGHGETLARYLDGGSFVVIDDGDPGQELQQAADAPPGGTFVVRLEDPSACLGWMLRRLEEGARVVVETRARTLEGARRTLLGVDAGPRAESWLSAHAVCWLGQRRSGGWTMRSE